uniref:Uncharacterized protein n=1 Tax=Caenorhabditis japonica TaxID=281687 RepID=A0A8R1EJ29_CAEJA
MCSNRTGCTFVVLADQHLVESCIPFLSSEHWIHANHHYYLFDVLESIRWAVRWVRLARVFCHLQKSNVL